MPIYEFYCPDCHTVFSFLSPRIDTGARPACPRCGRPELGRRPSRFATLKHRGEAGGEGGEPDPFAGMDESRLEGAMEALMREIPDPEAEEDPRAMGRLMRRFGDLTGLELGERMQEMVQRLEAGEDPASLEAELGDLEAGDETAEDFFKLKRALAGRRAQQPPEVDETLYPL